MQNKGSELPKEHILVCLSSSPSNERIVQMAGKMAQAFSGSLTALYVQTPGDADMNAEDTVRLQANMRLAQQLGAEIVTTHGEDAHNGEMTLKDNSPHGCIFSFTVPLSEVNLNE